MANAISIKKGLTQIVTVAISYGVSYAAATIATACGIQVTADQQTQIVIATTATLTGLVTAGLNW